MSLTLEDELRARLGLCTLQIPDVHTPACLQAYHSHIEMNIACATGCHKELTQSCSFDGARGFVSLKHPGIADANKTPTSKCLEFPGSEHVILQSFRNSLSFPERNERTPLASARSLCIGAPYKSCRLCCQAPPPTSCKALGQAPPPLAPGTRCGVIRAAEGYAAWEVFLSMFNVSRCRTALVQTEKELF